MSAAQDEFNELMRGKERRTAHPEDDDARSFLSLSDDDDDPTPPASIRPSIDGGPSNSTSLLRSNIPTTRFNNNTGPKGVISDAQAFRDARRNNRMSLRSTASLASHVHSLSLKALPELPQQERSIGEDESELDDEEDDHDFMNKWRQSRLNELQYDGPALEMKSRSKERSRRTYGSIATVDGEGYLNAVDGTAPDTVVVVYIYDDMSGVSAAIEDCLRLIAKKHSSTLFVKLHYQVAEIEPAGVPAILAYRGGDKFAGLVPVMEEIPDDADVSANTLEVLLKRHQILR